MRLIDAELLKCKARLLQYIDDHGCYVSVKAVDVNDIDEAETVDAAPGSNGTWIANDHSSAICSVCGRLQTTRGRDMTGNAHIHKAIFKYCPNCGARMDGEHLCD